MSKFTKLRLYVEHFPYVIRKYLVKNVITRKYRKPLAKITQTYKQTNKLKMCYHL